MIPPSGREHQPVLAESNRPRHFGFRFSRRFRLAALPFGVTPGRSWVTVQDGELRVRYGPWRVVTPLANVVSVRRTGPFNLLKAAGPARLSLADRGLTFASNPDAGLCIEFAEPVRGLEPTGALRHPGLTVTVTDPDGLRAALLAGRS